MVQSARQDGGGGASEHLQAAPPSSELRLSAVWRTVSRPTAAIRRSWRNFNDHLTRDQDFADAMSRRLDVWAAIGLLLTYTLVAVLIFVVNSSLYGNG